MTIRLIDRTVGALSGAVLFGSALLVVAAPSYAADRDGAATPLLIAQSDTTQKPAEQAPAAQAPAEKQEAPAQAAPETKPSGSMSMGHKSRMERVEDRIKSLHDELQITAAQEPLWGKVAEIMKSNARKMSGLMRKRAQEASTATAVDDLRAYQAIADAHAEGLRQLVPAWDALYNALSDDQKKTADDMFRHRPHRHGHEHKNG